MKILISFNVVSYYIYIHRNRIDRGQPDHSKELPVIIVEKLFGEWYFLLKYLVFSKRQVVCQTNK